MGWWRGGWLKGTTRKPTKMGKEAKKRRGGERQGCGKKRGGSEEGMAAAATGWEASESLEGWRVEEVQAVLLCKSFLGSWVVLAPRRCTSIESEAVVAAAAGYSQVEEGWKKPPPPNRVNTGSHFAINFFSAGPRRAPTPRHATAATAIAIAIAATANHGGPTHVHAHVHAHGGKVWTRSRKKGESRGGRAPPRYSTPAEHCRGREFSLSTPEQTEGGRGNGEKKRG